MPRSNKKKGAKIPSSAQPFLEPPPSSKYPCPRPDITLDKAMNTLFTKEKELMIGRAVASAKKHGINLRHGRSNPGAGDCAFEAVIYNINDRSDFKERLPMSIDWYRRTWSIDMANRTIHSDFNTLTNEEWLAGWNDMQTAGTYERGIFGDLMLPGIACGTRKYFLKFNTDINSPHDPIYVVDPSSFDVTPDTEIPVVLSYNLSHYESMEPCTALDVQMSIDLVKEYIEGRYRYNRHDLPYLISNQLEREDDKYNNAGRRKIIQNQMKAISNKAYHVGKNNELTSAVLIDDDKADLVDTFVKQCKEHQADTKLESHGNKETQEEKNTFSEEPPCGLNYKLKISHLPTAFKVSGFSPMNSAKSKAENTTKGRKIKISNQAQISKSQVQSINDSNENLCTRKRAKNKIPKEPKINSEEAKQKHEDQTSNQNANSNVLF